MCRMEVSSVACSRLLDGTVCLRIGLIGLFILATGVRGLERNGGGGSGGSPTCLNLTTDVGREVTLVCPTGNLFLFLPLDKGKGLAGGLTQFADGSTLHIKRIRKSSEGVYFCGRQLTKADPIGVVAIINVTLSGKEVSPRRSYPHFLLIVTGLGSLCALLIFLVITVLCMSHRQRRGKARLKRSRYKPDSSVSDAASSSAPRPPSRSQSQATCITIVESFSEPSVSGSPQREQAHVELRSQSRSSSVESLAVPKHNAKKYAYAIRSVHDVLDVGDVAQQGGGAPTTMRSCHTTNLSALASTHYSSSPVTIPKRNSRTGESASSPQH